MYISVTRNKKTGIGYVNLYEAYINGEGKKRARVVRSFGREDKLLENDPNAIEKLRAQYSEEREIKKQATEDHRMQLLMEELERKVDPGNSNGTPLPLLCYGHYPLRQIWNKVLELDKKLKLLQKASGTRIKCNYNDVVSFMVFLKILDPRSIMYSFGCQDNFLGTPLKDVTLDHMYSALDFVNSNKDDIFHWINSKMDHKFGNNRAKLVFYDVTNAYFETSLTDEERDYEQKDFAARIQEEAELLFSEGILTKEHFDDDGFVIPENLPSSFWEEDANDKLKYLRMRGPSKEHRTDLPIVSITLAIDQMGFPLDFEVYAGNASEFKTMKPTIRKLKEKYNIEEAIIVADRGLNSVKNLQMLQELNLGFLVAQKVTQFSNSLTKQMLDLSQYTAFDESNPSLGMYQVINNWEKTGTNGKKVNCMLVFNFNEKRKRRDDKILDIWVEIVKEKMEKGFKVGKRKGGWASLAKTDGETEQLITGIDEDVLAKKRQFSGFSALIYEDALSYKNKGEQQQTTTNNRSLTGREVACVYPTLNSIERCFRIMKTNLGLRPMYVRTSDHIRGHICICVLALLILRLLQNSLKSNNINLSINEIIESLGNATVAPLMTHSKISFILVGYLENIRKGRERIKTAQLKELIKDKKIEVSYMPKIMTACGLTPLPAASSMAELASCLATKFFALSDAVPEVRAA